MWHPSKEEITTWIEQKGRDFAQEQNQNPRISTEEWLQRYLFTDPHKILFVEFPIIFYEWLSKIAEKKNCFKKDQPTSWNPILINQLKSVSNLISQAVDFWFDSILGGYITEFIVDTIKSYSEAEREFFRGPRGKFMNSLKMWTEMLLCEKAYKEWDHICRKSDMLGKDIDWDNEIGRLRSGKRYKLEGKKRIVDRECKRYIEKGYNTVSHSDSEDYNDKEKRLETPKALIFPEVRHVNLFQSRSTTDSNSSLSSASTPITTMPPRKNMVGGEMKLPLFQGNGSEDPQQHWFLCEAV